MLNKNNNIASYLAVLSLGLLLGWFIWAGPKEDNITKDIHNEDDMFHMMSEMNQSLQGKSGDEFDIAFLDHMIIHHQGAIDAANLALQNAKHQEIINIAHAIISSQSKEIEQMKVWEKNWYYGQ